MNKCVECKVDDRTFFCTNCGYILPIDNNINYFDLFDISPEINLNDHDLQYAYFNLQAMMHPDKFITKSDEELKIAVTNSAIINTAYKTLTNKFNCAEYLVSLHHKSESSVPDDFTKKIFCLYESKFLGVDITHELETLKNSLWFDLIFATQVRKWKKASIIIAKLRVVMKITNQSLKQ